MGCDVRYLKLYPSVASYFFLVIFSQVVAQGILKYCLRGMLAQKQRDTFFCLLDVLTRVLQESHICSALDQLEQDMNEALALMERDFPMSKQVGS